MTGAPAGPADVTALDAASEQEGELENESFVYKSHRCGAVARSCRAAGLRAHLRPLTPARSLPLKILLACGLCASLTSHPKPEFVCRLYLCILYRAPLVTEKMLNNICSFQKQL